jgi:hypothetical protein
MADDQEGVLPVYRERSEHPRRRVFHAFAQAKDLNGQGRCALALADVFRGVSEGNPEDRPATRLSNSRVIRKRITDA